MDNGTHRGILRYQGSLAVTLGALVALAAVYLDEEQVHAGLYHASLQLFQTLGIALVAFGVFGVLVDTRNWRAYFGERLREVVLEQAYLSNLDRSILSELQVRILKVLFRDPALDREGGFLSYFNRHLHGLISTPYRESVSAEVQVKPAGAGRLRVVDRVTYTCRRAGESIQEFVRWQPEPGEIAEIESLHVEVQYPGHHEKKGARVELANYTDPADLKHEEKTFPLEAYREVDGLIVRINAQYLVEQDRFQTWEMAHPTRNFEFFISLPDGYGVQVKPLVLHPELCQITREANYARVAYDSWMLPQSGVAWRVLPPSSEKARAEVQAGDSELAPVPAQGAVDEPV